MPDRISDAEIGLAKLVHPISGRVLATAQDIRDILTGYAELRTKEIVFDEWVGGHVQLLGDLVRLQERVKKLEVELQALKNPTREVGCFT